MKILFDNINFSIQSAGGISALWYEIMSRSLKDPEMNIQFLDMPAENIFRNMLDIPNDKIIHNPLNKLPVKAQRYINPKSIKNKGIFHSSYYRTINNSSMANVTTVHDFVHEHYRKGLARFVHSMQKGYAINRSNKIICV